LADEDPDYRIIRCEKEIGPSKECDVFCSLLRVDGNVAFAKKAEKGDQHRGIDGHLDGFRKIKMQKGAEGPLSQ
jgi:hypothetical protein